MIGLLILIILSVSINIGLIYAYTSLLNNCNKNNGKNNRQNTAIYRDIKTDKIYNPDDVLPSVPGNYSQYLNSFKVGQPITTESHFDYVINKNGFLLNSISNLPPNKVVGITFNDMYINMQVNNNGILYFNDNLEPIPIGLMIDVKVIQLHFDNDHMNTITLYENVPIYSNIFPYNTPIANYTILNDSDKNKYFIPYSMVIMATGICPPCFDSNHKLISNVTFSEKFNLKIESANTNTKTSLYPISGQSEGHDLCTKTCS